MRRKISVEVVLGFMKFLGEVFLVLYNSQYAPPLHASENHR